jgi:hypothetical protein
MRLTLIHEPLKNGFFHCQVERGNNFNMTNIGILGKKRSGKSKFICMLKNQRSTQTSPTVGLEVHPMDTDLIVYEFGEFAEM